MYIQKITLVTKRRTERQAVIFIQKIKTRKVKKVKIMCRRTFLFPEEAEKEVAEIRRAEGIDEKTEKLFIKEVVKNAKANSRIGDKVLICIDPKYIHYPEWQREIRVPKALSIGNKSEK